MIVEAQGSRPDVWHIELFGRLSAQRGERQITRFSTHKTGALLACLAQDPYQPRLRADLYRQLWPAYELDRARNCLRIALSTLRVLFEPNPSERGRILLADRTQLGLNPALISTDKAAFEESIAAGLAARDDRSRMPYLQRAVDLYREGLLPGFDEAWISEERLRMADSYHLALRQLVRAYLNARQFEDALSTAKRALDADPLREESRRLLAQVYALTGRISLAYRLSREDNRVLTSSTPAAVTEVTEKADMVELEDARESATEPSARRAFRVEVGSIRPETRQLSVVDQVCDLLQTPGTRLVTLTGSAGIGKSRIARAVTDRMHRHADTPIWFVSLEDVVEEPLLVPTIAAAMQLPRFSPQTRWYQLRDALNAEPAILVLDGGDHLKAEVCRLLAGLLKAVPTVRFLVSFRKRLGLPDEYEHVVHPLGVPAVFGDTAEALATPSCRLWLKRAMVARPAFRLTPVKRKAVIALCRRLAGVPLAVELAAAWTGSLSPKQVLESLQFRSGPVPLADPLASGPQTAYLVLDWSWRRLAPSVQQFMARLSVFRGGWTVGAAEAVCEEPRAREHLEELHVRRLVLKTTAGGNDRYAIGTTVCEFAEARLAEVDRAAVAERRYAYFAKMAAEAEAASTTGERGVWLTRLGDERNNLQAAMQFSLQFPDRPELALALSANLFWYWYSAGDPQEGCYWLDSSLANGEFSEQLPLRTKAVEAFDTLAYAGDFDILNLDA